MSEESGKRKRQACWLPVVVAAILASLVTANVSLMVTDSVVHTPTAQATGKPANVPKPLKTAAVPAEPKVADSVACTAEQIKKVPAFMERVTARPKEVRQNSHLLRVDPETKCELWETPRGRYWVVEGNMDTFAIALGEEEDDMYGTEGVKVRRGDVVLDCGAQLGAFTRPALDAGASLVVAIDVSPRNIVCLSKTFAAEIKKGRVKIYPKGVWNKDDMLQLYEDGQTIGDTVVLHKQTKGNKVPLTTIDKIVQELALSRVDFIKMDVEGAEVPALEGAAETLRRFRPRMSISSYHLPGDAHDVPWAARQAVPSYWVTVPICKIFHNSIRPLVTLFR